MCQCISDSQPELGGIDHAQAATQPGSDRPVALDHCIADSVERLWDAGIGTLGSCCGHNTARPSIVLSHHQDGEQARLVLEADSRDWEILAWVLQPVGQPEPSR